MLKLYKTTIIASTFAALISCTLSIVCEFFSFSHALLLQNYAVGISCSLIVVIITTVLQYLHEHKKVYNTYCNSLQRLLSVLSTVFHIGESFDDKTYDYLFEIVDTALNTFEKNNQHLLWFSRKKQKLQETVLKCFLPLWISFEQPRFESKKACIVALEKHPKYVPLIKAAIDILPNDHDKNSIKEMYKDIL